MDFRLNKRYNFLTLYPVILGDGYKNMKVKAILTASEAYKYRDIYTLHEQVLKNLPQNIRATDLTYILFEDIGGTTIVLPVEYIQPNSIIEVTKVRIYIEIPDADTDDVNILQEQLTALGYKRCKITHEEYSD